MKIPCLDKTQQKSTQTVVSKDSSSVSCPANCSILAPPADLEFIPSELLSERLSQSTEASLWSFTQSSQTSFGGELYATPASSIQTPECSGWGTEDDGQEYEFFPLLGESASTQQYETTGESQEFYPDEDSPRADFVEASPRREESMYDLYGGNLDEYHPGQLELKDLDRLSDWADHCWSGIELEHGTAEFFPALDLV